MRSRTTNLRAKVVALLVSLVALWSFAAWVTLRDGINLLGMQTVDSQVVGPSEPFLLALQAERRLSTAQLGNASRERTEALAAGRGQVDKSAGRFLSTARSFRAGLATDAKAEQLVGEVIAALDTLPATRQAVDSRSLDRAAAGNAFTSIIDTLFRLYDVVGGLDDPEIQTDTRNLIELYRIRELISQEDALLSGALAVGRLTADEHVQFTQLVAVQRFLTGRAAGQLRESDRAHFNQVIDGKSFTALRALEGQLLSGERGTSQLAVTGQNWSATAEAALTELQNMVLGAGDAVVERAAPVAVGVVVRLVLAAGLGLLAVIASIVVSVTTARALVSQLQRLRAAAYQLADEQLPTVVERLGRGEVVDVAVAAPPLDFGDDEIGQVGHAFNRVQETAIRTAVEQAELRRTVRDVFLSIARRTQALVHRQVTLLDAMERREQDADELEDLFRIDHLATRMRRNAENLILLSGSSPGRAWRRDVPMVDVARAAWQEVEDYARVTVVPFEPVGLAGRAAGDVIHLLAELIENALTFSPPHTEVVIRGQLVAKGFAIEIEDRGLGMDEEALSAANDQITQNREFSLSNANQLGLFVVSRLAQRHHLSVQLRTSPYGGTTAIVLIPMDLITNAELAGAALKANRLAVDAGSERSSIASSAHQPTSVASGGAVALVQKSDYPAPTLPVPTLEFSVVPQDATPPAVLPVRTGKVPPAAAAADPADSQGSHTPGGLPVRVRQTNLAPQLRTGTTPAADTGELEPARSPDQVRRMMSSYQSGCRLGRAAAERLLDANAGPDVDPHDSVVPGTDR